LKPLSVTLPFAARFTCLGDSAAVRHGGVMACVKKAKKTTE
jgi:hypothetical protein